MDIFIYIFGFFLTIIAKILPEWVIWPDIVLDGIDYVVRHLADFNIIFPIDQLFIAISLLLNFFMYYGLAKVIMMGVNYFRGSGKIDV